VRFKDWPASEMLDTWTVLAVHFLVLLWAVAHMKNKRFP